MRLYRTYCEWFDAAQREWFVIHEWLNGEEVVVAVGPPEVRPRGF